MYFARVEMKSDNPEQIYKIVQRCPFCLTCFRLSGDFNLSILMAGFSLDDIEKIINFHFRNNCKKVSVVLSRKGMY